MTTDHGLNKPLGMKAYGHIPHLPGSRLTQGDHLCTPEQADIATVKARDEYDRVSVTVKLDGSCVAVANIDGMIVPLIRSGCVATASKYEQHQLFAQWVYENQGRFLTVLKDGERFVGEWLAQAHGTRYNLTHEPFVPFDFMVGNQRSTIAETIYIAESVGLPSPYLLWFRAGESFSLNAAIKALAIPHHGELDPVEGAVWRVERHRKFDFICKWVRPNKIDGKYLVSGEPIWNWRPPHPPGPDG